MTIGLTFDLLVLAAILISAGIAFFRGFIHELLTILGVIGGVIISFMMGPVFLPMVKEAFGIHEGEDIPLALGAIPMDWLAVLATYGGLFLIFIIVLNIAAHFIGKGVATLGLGPVDRTLGAIFGIARGVLVLAALYLPLHLLLSPAQKEDWFATSQTQYYIAHVSEWLAGFLPENMLNDAYVAAESEDARQLLQKLDVLEGEGKSGLDNSSNSIPESDRRKLDELIAPPPPNQ